MDLTKLILTLLTVLTTVSMPAAQASGGFPTFLGALSPSVGIQEHVLTLAFVVGLILFAGILYSKRIAKMAPQDLVVPDHGISLRNMIEALGQAMYDVVESTVGKKHVAHYFPMACGLFLLILVSNLIGVIPGFSTPSANMNTTLALGVITFVYYNVEGIMRVGFVKHVKHLMGPVLYLAPLMFVIEVFSHFVRPLTLGLRLGNNLNADHMVLDVFYNLAPYGVPVIFMMLGTLICIIQAFVFTLLTLVYVSLAIEDHDHDH